MKGTHGMTGRHARSLGLVLLSVLLLLGVTSQHAGAVVTRTGNHILVGSNETIDDDLFASGGTVSILGHIKGDLVVVATTEVDISGVIDGDLLVASPKTVVSGTIHGSIRGVTSSLLLKGNVDRNLFLLAQQVDTTSASSVLGNDAVLASQAVLAGQVGRGIDITATSLNLQAHVARAVDATAQQIQIAPQARIGGNLSYVSDEVVTVPAGTVAGTVSRTSPRQAQRSAQATNSVEVGRWLHVLWLIGTVILGLIAVRLMPGTAARSRAALLGQPLATFGIGGLLCVGLPVVAAAVGITFIGLPVAIVVLAGWVAGLELGWVFAAAALATAVVGSVQRGGDRPPQELLVVAGLLVLFILTELPLLGGPIWLIILFLGFGAIARSTRLKPQPSTDTVAFKSSR